MEALTGIHPTAAQRHKIRFNVPVSRTQHPPLRIGLFAAGHMQPRAIIDAFVAIASSAYAELVLLSVGNHPVPKLPWLLRLYRRLDTRTLGTMGTRPDPAELLDLSLFLPAKHLLPMPTAKASSEQRDQWLAAVATRDLDVAFTLGSISPSLPGDSARHGVWRFGSGDAEDWGNGLEGWREVMDGTTVSSARLHVRLPDARERVLYQSWSCTPAFSVVCNRRNLLRRAAQLPARALQALYTSGALQVQPAPPLNAPGVPGYFATARHLLKLSGKILRRGWQKFAYIDQWFLAYRFGVTAHSVPASGEFTCLMPPRDRFWGDPFSLLRGGRYFIFFEELMFATGKGHISVIEVAPDGRSSTPQKVLERDYHLSYPFLIEDQGQLFMVPESGDNGTVELYRCVHFPDSWVLEKVLLRGACYVDATIHRFSGQWWMFVNIGNDKFNLHDELHVYYADALNGDWQPHHANPVKSDVRSARSAGRFYQRNGRLYRPAQICAPLYGSGIAINHVIKLTHDEYKEREVARITPAVHSGILGIHTLNHSGKLSVVDGFTRRWRFASARWASLSTFSPHYQGVTHGKH